MSTNQGRKKRQVVGFLGVGLDNKDGHQRLTRHEQFVLVGGSRETHEQMQDIASKFNEELRERGQALQETSPEEVEDLLRKASETH